MIHNGTFTLIGPNGHRTVRVKTVLESDTTPPALVGKRIVYLMVGPDNVFDYIGVAFLNDDDTIKVWRKFEGSQNEKIVKVFRSLMLNLPTKTGKTLAELGYRVEEARSCRMCNRLLTNPESIERGVGPECASK